MTLWSIQKSSQAKPMPLAIAHNPKPTERVRYWCSLYSACYKYLLLVGIGGPDTILLTGELILPYVTVC